MPDSRVEIKKEALINEYKGNLFEYLVGQKISQAFKKEQQFLANLLPEFKKRLEFYENELRLLDAELIKFLMQAANATSSKIIDELRISPSQIFITGKTTHEGECDLFLIDEFNQSISISLKFAKNKSYVNTKSGGAKSFIETYFSSYSESKNIQNTFNELISSAWTNMGQKLYDEEGLGEFDQFKIWKERNLTELPGELIGKNKETMLSYYEEIIRHLEDQLKLLAKSDPLQFEKCLMTIIGFSPTINFQVITEHEKDVVANVRVIDALDIKTGLDNFKFSTQKSEAKSSFSINFSKFILQIRIKPMNKFTAGSMKVNCSVKYY